MPAKPRRIIAIPKHKGIGEVYIGPDRRENVSGRRQNPGRRANANDFMKSVVLGRREKSMDEGELQRIKEGGWSGRRDSLGGSRIVTAIDWQGKIPESANNVDRLVVQTSRRKERTRRTGLDRRHPKKWIVKKIKKA